jgi:hypothetical protein
VLQPDFQKTTQTKGFFKRTAKKEAVINHSIKQFISNPPKGRFFKQTKENLFPGKLISGGLFNV